MNATTKDARLKKRVGLQEKLQSLLRPTNERSMTTRVVNLSKRIFSPAEISLLSKGIGFNHTDATPTNFLAGLESVLLVSVLPEDRRADIRSCATGILRQKRRQQTLPADEAQGLQSLKSDHNIVVVPADKGGATVSMDRIDYVNKANKIFSDIAAYTPLAEDPTKRQVAAIKKKANELARLKVISPDDSKLMMLSDPHIARAGDDLLKKELAYLYRLFRFNGYPASFVKNCLRHQAQPQVPTLNGENVSRQFFSLPYMQGTSEVIARRLNRSGIHIAHKPASSLRAALSRIKDPLPKEQQTNVIYRIPCSNCSCVYVGHTGRSLGTRIKGHKLAVRRRDPLSLVFAHALECDHRFNWDGTEVVAMANTKRTREFLEAWYSNAGSINRHVDLDAHYEGLRSRVSAPCPNHVSTAANTEARSPTDSPPTLQHSVP
ncbi:hypothetical protein SprV_0301171300 [Sparganum proliferum]